MPEIHVPLDNNLKNDVSAIGAISIAFLITFTKEMIPNKDVRMCILKDLLKMLEIENEQERFKKATKILKYYNECLKNKYCNNV